jgi:hypothetical protein
MILKILDTFVETQYFASLPWVILGLLLVLAWWL